ncbi:hypothetical protein V7654_15285, partial [Bacillus sp. JJ1609]|uniref:hypothetical protein n=1 Tax=Bacillus sp. JJ1609 TaxID=3122977 RepID=UPI002FFF4831
MSNLQTTIQPAFTLTNNCVQEKGATNKASWLPERTNIGKKGATIYVSWLPERTNIGKRGHQ